MSIEGLENVVNEMDVQDRYRTALRRAFSDIIFESKYRTDGLGYSKLNKLRILLEQKYNYNLNKISERVEVIAQIIAYIKKIHENDPTIVPKVALLGDENETLLIEVVKIINYISVNNYDWSLPPSKMFLDKNLCNDLAQDEYIKNLFVYDPKKQFKEIVTKIKQINKGINVPRVLTEKNIDRVFKYFTEKITIKRNSKKINDNDSVNLFAHIMLHPDSVMLNEKTKLLFTGMFKEPLTISDIHAYKSFIQEYSRNYTPKQKHFFTAILDRLIHDTTRRKQGEFFTQTIWVDKAHEYITSVYGKDWKENDVVWDPAWGTGNLTRDYKFKELYVSTLNQSDIDIANQMRYNPEATKFRFDFLNDDYDLLPKGLRDAIESGRDITILMNSPYATSSNIGETSKSNITNTLYNKLMKDENWGEASKNLYAQFLFRICKLQEKNKNIKICFYSPPLFLTGVSFKNFRNKFFESFGFECGFLFEASNFSDVANGWGIAFSIFGKPNNVKNYFEKDILILDKLDNNEVEIKKIGKKILYNTDNLDSATENCKINLKGIKCVDTVQLKNSLTTGCSNIVKVTNNMLAYIDIKANNVESNKSNVSLFSTARSNRGGLSIIKENFNKVTSLFAARKLIDTNWINCKDEYLTPNEEHEKYTQFKNDSIVYSLFNNSSQQSSLRQITYKDKLWDIKNEFFWMPKEEMMDLANDINYTELYNDARTDNNRYVHNLLFGEQKIYEQLSPDTKLVLDKATELVRLSMNMRSDFADDHNHLNSWDAGYAQLKLVWKEYFPEKFKEFRQLYKNLEDRMRPLVYELGFLLK
jgi:hypothetical protein